MKKPNYHRLTFREKIIIQALWDSLDITQTEIARRLNRHKSTICREIDKWVDHKNSYNAKLAQWYSDQNYADKHFKDRISTSEKLKQYVFDGLKNNLSPEQVAGRIKLDYPRHPEMAISHEAIYSFIYRCPQGALNKKFIKLLPQQRSRRRKPM